MALIVAFFVLYLVWRITESRRYLIGATAVLFGESLLMVLHLLYGGTIFLLLCAAISFFVGIILAFSIFLELWPYDPATR